MKTYTIIRRPAELHWQDVPALAVDECLWHSKSYYLCY